MQLEALSFDSLPGWHEDDHAEALGVFSNSCRELVASGSGFVRSAVFSGRQSDWRLVCSKAQAVAGSGVDKARAFFERSFVPVRLLGIEGHFTGYFEPEVPGSLTKSVKYDVPVLKRPDDLMVLSKPDATRIGLTYGRITGGRAQPYHTRREIEQGILNGRGLELVYLKSWADLFFMQVQGSGRIRLPDGSVIRLAYAAKSGLPYTSIGKVLIDRGQMNRDGMSMQTLRSWLEAHPEQARELMWRNQSYVFFRKLENIDPKLGPVGAQQLPLTPFRSLAADREYWALGVPVWVSTHIHKAGALSPFRRMMIVQDTGSAIKGPQRGDIFFGTGAEASIGAGKLDQAGELIAILPKALADRLLQQGTK